jgi:hypothetical protein
MANGEYSHTPPGLLQPHPRRSEIIVGQDHIGGFFATSVPAMPIHPDIRFFALASLDVSTFIQGIFQRFSSISSRSTPVTI